MGLDSVELVVEFEKYFGISIPDREAEQIATIEQAAACIVRLLNMQTDASRTAVYYAVLEPIVNILQSQYPAVSEYTKLVTLAPDAVEQAALRRQVAKALQLDVPELPSNRPQLPQGWIGRLLQIPVPAQPDFSGMTVADLADWVVSVNYRALLPKPNTLYEVQRVVVGISGDKLGVEVPEIRLADSFTNDLGVD